MNAKQLAAAQTVTSERWIHFNIGSSAGQLTFTKQMDDQYGVLLYGSNVDTVKWFEPMVCVSIRIGKRGGIKKTIHHYGL